MKALTRRGLRQEAIRNIRAFDKVEGCWLRLDYRPSRNNFELLVCDTRERVGYLEQVVITDNTAKDLDRCVRFCLNKLNAIFRMKRAWIAACEYDHLPTDTLFVCFSDDNPFANEYNDAALVVNNFAHLPSLVKE